MDSGVMRRQKWEQEVPFFADEMYLAAKDGGVVKAAKMGTGGSVFCRRNVFSRHGWWCCKAGKNVNRRFRFLQTKCI